LSLISLIRKAPIDKKERSFDFEQTMVGALGFAAHGVITNELWRVDSSPTGRLGCAA
jgi:hypothetical protein